MHFSPVESDPGITLYSLVKFSWAPPDSDVFSDFFFVLDDLDSSEEDQSEFV